MRPPLRCGATLSPHQGPHFERWPVRSLRPRLSDTAHLHHNASRREFPIGVRLYHVIMALLGLQEEPTGTCLQDLTVLAEFCWCSSLAACTMSVRASDSYCTEVTLLGFCLAPTLWRDWFLSPLSRESSSWLLSLG